MRTRSGSPGGSTWGRKAIAAVGRLRPDVLVLDLELPGMDGFDVLEIARWCSPTTAVLILLRGEQEALTVQALICGAMGCLVKDERAELATAIRVVRRGEVWGRRRIVARVIEELVERIE